MFSKLILILTLSLLLKPFFAFSLETDQYMTFETELSDSSAEIDQLINEQMNQAVVKLSPDLSCLEASHEVLSWVGGQYGDKTGVPEEHILENTQIDIFPDRSLERSDYIGRSVYQDSLTLKTFPLAPTLKLNGVYVGSDKVGHFFSVGRYYYRVYLRSRKLRMGHQRAMQNSFEMGLISEKTYYGYMASGVFSFADLQANYDGFRWILSFCNKQTPKLYKENGKWHWSNDFKIANYASPLWDESYNTNSYTRRRGKQVTQHLNQMCSNKRVIELMHERFSYYTNNYQNYFQHDFRNLLSPKERPEQIKRYCQD